MYPTCSPFTTRRPLRTGVAVVGAFLLAVAAGCGQPSSGSPVPPPAPAAEPAGRTVAVVKPERKTVRREVGEPGYIQAFEETPIVAKVSGYVRSWNVDIGQRLRKGDVLAELSVPELVAELQQKDEQVRQAEKMLAMAGAQVVTAKAQVEERKAGLARAEADRNYWRSQSERMTRLTQGSQVVDRQTAEEAANQLRSASAALKEAEAKVTSARANQAEKEAAKDKAEADVRAAEADRRRVAALVGYTQLTAPYDGVVTQRTVNTGQFVQPATGVKGDVLFRVERTDVVRVFVAVPEAEAAWVGVGAPARVRVQALLGQEFGGRVTRTAWSLNNTTRTLLTEIDLANPDGRLRPGMYAYASVTGEHRDVLTVPASAVTTQGDVNTGYQTFCYLVEYGKVRRTPVEVGARNDQLVEVLKKQTRPAGAGEGSRWEPFTGEEEVVKGDLTGLKDGQAVEVRAGK
jgi:multidrug efflux pump subunit AcrA (membrane-fusion protein)